MEQRRETSARYRCKVVFLSRPESYPTTPRRVEVVETHMSWVFLTDCHAYKLKKPVRYDYLDFSTLACAPKPLSGTSKSLRYAMRHSGYRKPGTTSTWRLVLPV
jgi:hypothetical protein